MSVLERFDTWVQSGPFTPRDLGRYRIVYCVLLFFLVPRLSWLADYPDSFYKPPTGPFQLLSGFPPGPVLTAIELAVFAFLAGTLLGWYTTVCSIGLSIALMVDYGLAFSVGKVDHSMVMVIVPLILAFSRWGDCCSLDALRRRRAAAPSGSSGQGIDLDDPAAQLQWPVRLLGLAIGTAFVSAALPKLMGGWLSLSTQASYAYQVRSEFASGRPSWLSDLLVQMRFPPMWEFLDWATVLLEGLAVLALLSWRSWRIVLAFLALFHVGIGLSLGIWFGSNVVAYAAFVAWGRLPLPKLHLPERWGRLTGPAAIPIVAVAAVALWWLGGLISGSIEYFRMVMIVVAAGVATWYLAMQVVTLVTRRHHKDVAVS